MPAAVAFDARAVAASAILMAIWWITEAVPIPVTALLPLVIFPLLGLDDMSAIAAPYADPVIFLVMGGVLLGLATQRWNLHRRVALLTISLVGTRTSQIVLGLMLASAFISAWVSNTATAVIMVPIGASILLLLRSIGASSKELTASMLLGIAYAVTIGSMMTLIGQPPMALMKAYLESEHGIAVPFSRWMLVGVPFGLVMLFLTWLMLTKVVFRAPANDIPGGKELIRDELRMLGPVTGAERSVMVVFGTAIFAWVGLPFIADVPAVAEALPFLARVNDSAVAVAAAVALFLIPAGRNREGTRVHGALLDWGATKEVPWGLLILFGGGLALSAQFTATGLSAWVGEQVGGLSGMPPILILLVAAAVGLALTELTSNTATAAALFPIMGAVALGIGIDPLLMTVVMTLAVSSAFMLPVATPSNAVAFASGDLEIKQMVRAGVWLNLGALVLIIGAVYTVIPAVFGASL
jgi:sodium-dependent dicarboxylate transporter 2/3/5